MSRRLQASCQIRGATRCLLLLLFVLLLERIQGKPFRARSTTTTAILSPKTAILRGGDQLDALQPAPPPEQAVLTYNQKCNERANFVKYTLHRRLEYVKKGKRMRDFGRWVRQQKKGTSTVISMHGVDDDNKESAVVCYTDSNEPVPVAMENEALRSLEHDPFSADRMNLDIVLTSQSPEDCFVSKSNEFVYQRPNTLQLCLRAVRLGIHFAPVWSTAGLALVSKSFRENVWYKWLASAIGSSGAAWIKWGQWSSTRNDMFPEALCDHLASLHNSAPAHPWSYSQKSVEHSLGLGRGTLGCVFDEFDHEPLASGSIAQVHKADLCGVPVAVKIRHPRVQQLIDMDFRLMTFAAGLVDKIPALSWLHIRESVEQFSHTMAAQAFLQVEAHHLEVLNYNFRRWPRVKFPTPFYASSSVIIETFEPGKIATDIIDKYDIMASAVNSEVQREKGVTVQEIDDDSAAEEDMKSDAVITIAGHELMPLDLSKFLVSAGVSMYLKMLLVDNVMHADLHPGNIMVDAHYRNADQSTTKEGNETADDDTSQKEVVGAAMNDEADHIQITLVDAGMVAQLNDQESTTFIGLMSSLGEGDGAEAAKFALQFSVENDTTEEQRSAFTADMVELFAEKCRGYGTNVEVGEVLRGVLGLIRKHHVRIDANFATLVINALCIESLAGRVCPGYNVLDAAQPLLRGYRRLAYQKKDGTFKKSRLFYLWMSVNSLKKEFLDMIFFLREAKRKLTKQKRIAQTINVSPPSPSSSIPSIPRWPVVALLLLGTTVTKIIPIAESQGLLGRSHQEDNKR